MLLVYVLSHFLLFLTPWTVACHSPLSRRFSRQGYLSGLPSSCRGSSQPRDQTCNSCVSCIGGGFFSTEPSGKSCLGASLFYIFYPCFNGTFLKRVCVFLRGFCNSVEIGRIWFAKFGVSKKGSFLEDHFLCERWLMKVL